MKTSDARGNESGVSVGVTTAPGEARDTGLAASSRNEQALQRAALAVSRGGGAHVYEALITELARILEVDVAFVAVFDDVGQTHMRSLAAWLDGRPLRNFGYALSGTPCAQVVGRDFRYVEQGVSAEFAPDTIFAAKGMDCYAAYPLFGAAGESLGLLVTMNRTAMADPALAESMLKIFAVRISAEIEREHGEEALRANATQYRAMFDAWEDALVLRDADFRIVDVNTTYEKFTGRKREEVIGIDRVIANPPGVDERVKALHGRALAGESIQLETELLNVNGTRRDLELRGVPMRHQGQPHVLYIGRDISARKRAEAERAVLETQLRQSQKMEAIGQLTGGIAHDFNNILQGVIGYVVLAKERQQESDDPRVGRYLDRAHAAADRAGNLIKQMLTFSRGQRGERLSLSPMPLVEEATHMLRSTLPSTIDLRVLADKDVPAILVDPIQFEQVLLNLSINARDAMDNEGDIDVVTRIADVQESVCASCRQRVAGLFVELAVRDSGPGIPSDIMERMFEPFYTSKEVGKGSGMGLAMVHGIVHDHGGHILVESALGKGTSIRVMFPRHGADSTAPSERGGSEFVASSNAILQGHVLVAEDDVDVRELLFDLLTSWGLEVTPAMNGAEALTVFEADSRRFDLLLTDLTMPAMTGVALARAVTRLRPGLPVLLCTAFSDDFRDAEINDAGVKDVLRKPIDPFALRACLTRLLANTVVQPGKGSRPPMR